MTKKFLLKKSIEYLKIYLGMILEENRKNDVLCGANALNISSIIGVLEEISYKERK